MVGIYRGLRLHASGWHQINQRRQQNPKEVQVFFNPEISSE
jgi:hypothetical protein